MSVRRPLSLCLAVQLAVLALLAAASAAPAAMKIRVAKPSPQVTIPNSTAVGTYFEHSQRFSTTCRGRERALAPGVVDAPRHIVGQSFGPSAVGGYATGVRGRARLRLQLLCASGVGIVHRRKPGKTRPVVTGGRTTYTTNARVGCGARRYAIGAPLSQEFSPGFGRFSSRPAGPSAWQVTVEGIPASFPFQTSVPAYADVACVPKSSLKALRTIEGSTRGLHGGRSARLRLTCKGGRRAVGWGVDLRPFTRSTSRPSDDGWSLPIVRKAALAGSAVAFQFDLPPGARTGAENGLGAGEVAQTGYVVCAKPA